MEARNYHFEVPGVRRSFSAGVVLRGACLEAGSSPFRLEGCSLHRSGRGPTPRVLAPLGSPSMHTL